MMSPMKEGDNGQDVVVKFFACTSYICCVWCVKVDGESVHSCAHTAMRHFTVIHESRASVTEDEFDQFKSEATEPVHV
jgi:hypothetical protein